MVAGVGGGGHGGFSVVAFAQETHAEPEVSHPFGTRPPAPALAVPAAVVGAGTAHRAESVRQCPTSPVAPDRRSRGRDPQRLGHVLYPFAVELDTAEEVGLVGPERGKQFRHALANGLMQIVVALSSLRCGGGLCLCSPASVSPAHMIDQGVSKDLVEPRHGRLILAQLVGLGEGLHIRILEDVIGRPRVLESPPEGKAANRSRRSTRV